MSGATKRLKADAKLQIVWGEVYVPDMPDTHGDFMNAEEIRKMAYKFSLAGDMGAVDVMHDNVRYGCCVVETFIVRSGDPDFPIVGAWVVGVHVPDKALWDRIEEGELNGFSMEALAYRREATVEVNVQPVLRGKTDVVDGHEHEFEAWFDDKGELIGGITSEAADQNGVLHRHAIKRSVQSEESMGHTHRFSYIEDMVLAGAVT